MGFTFDRDFYVPKGAEKVEFPGVVFYKTEYDQRLRSGGTAKRYQVLAFYGKQAKPVINYSYSSESARQEMIDRTLAGVKARADYKAKVAAERKAATAGLDVGDVVVASWGYDQTNVDAYQVVGRKGKNGVILRKIGMARVESNKENGAWDGPMSTYLQPVKDSFLEKEEPFYRLARDGSVKIDDVRYASKWDGKRGYYNSWYA